MNTMAKRNVDNALGHEGELEMRARIPRAKFYEESDAPIGF